MAGIALCVDMKFRYAVQKSGCGKSQRPWLLSVPDPLRDFRAYPLAISFCRRAGWCDRKHPLCPLVNLVGGFYSRCPRSLTPKIVKKRLYRCTPRDASLTILAERRCACSCPSSNTRIFCPITCKGSIIICSIAAHAGPRDSVQPVSEHRPSTSATECGYRADHPRDRVR
jgi:hypothetical protein